MRWGAILVVVLLLAPVGARSAEYDPHRAGHPIRIVAYVLHPVGMLLDYAIFRPAWWLGQREPIGSIFGVERDPSDELPAD